KSSAAFPSCVTFKPPERLPKFFHSEAEKAKQQSKTNTYPQTWDKVLKLLQEIDEILQSEYYVV
ncbi:MAG: hypothetical protein PUP91_35520, partial [Rhizonema sp. PD37]|nr:hypothetical protein [Rhizonema sp. PD37]